VGKLVKVTTVAVSFLFDYKSQRVILTLAVMSERKAISETLRKDWLFIALQIALNLDEVFPLLIEMQNSRDQ
jgi:hypothetical protein